MKDIILIEVDCEHRNNVGACGISVAGNCLYCPLGQDWIKNHVTKIVEHTELWGWINKND